MRRDTTAMQAVKKAIEAVEGKRQKARPVDPREAARGRLDYVQVKDWGGGSPEDLESMQVPPPGCSLLSLFTAPKSQQQ